jgi:hypothetical protein
MDFMTDLEQSAAGLHELFRALIQAGFTEAQALEIVKAGVAGSMKG